jgi:hypothetical protein
VCAIQPTQAQVGDYLLDNNPPRSLAFDPLTDICYYESSPETEAVLFRLDLSSGQSRVQMRVQNSIALTFEPMTENIFGIGYNLAASGPPGSLWKENIGNLRSSTVGRFPFALQTSLAFVPMTAAR